MSLLLALSADKVPNQEALALSPTVGWIMLFGAICIALIFILGAERWRRFWFHREDPRTIAIFRIVFGFFVIANVNGLWEHMTFLFTDEGIFPADVARQVHASAQFQGFGDGWNEDDPWGFFDLHAFIEFLKGPKYSLLYIWDSPTFFWSYLIAFEIIAISFMIGFKTRIMGVLTWFMMNGLFVRNHLFWEGTELVYRCFLAYLILARSGHAYSVDNWLRCKKLRKQGLLSEPDGPGGGAGLAPSPEHPRGLEAIYRRIPAWPRRLIMMQLATIYITTGTLKTGGVWAAGDSLYYALNLDHFYQFPPQFMASMLGTTVFRGLTWFVKVGQTGFIIVLFGLFARFIMREKIPLAPGRVMWIRLAFAGALLSSAGVIWVTWPVHFHPNMHPAGFVAIWLGIWGAAWGLWWALENRDIRVRGHRLDRDWLCRWVLGRRIWLVWHIGFHAHIFSLMNVGQFQTGMLSATLVFLEGHEVATFLRMMGKPLGKWGVPFIPASVTRGDGPIPAENPDLPHLPRDRSALPEWAMGVGLATIVGGILVKVFAPDAGDFRWLWAGGFGFMAVVAYARAKQAKQAPVAVDGHGRLAAPWAHGPLGRFTIGTLLAWHLTAVPVWLLPAKDSLGAWRPQARKVFAKWLTVTTTDQGWGMFAPNPPRSNVFLKVLVTDANGETWDLKTDVYAEEQKPIPWVWNTRQRKMNRRIIGGESGPTQWYRKWHARYHCRQWALEHDGEAPEKVELVKIWYRIPTPEQTRDRGYYIAEELLEKSGREKVEYTEYCKNAVMGQLPDWIRERHGLDPLPEDTPYRPWVKHKKKKWERKREREQKRKEAGE